MASITIIRIFTRVPPRYHGELTVVVVSSLSLSLFAIALIINIHNIILIVGSQVHKEYLKEVLIVIYSDSHHSIPLSTLIIALLYELREPLIIGDYLLSFDNHLEIVHDTFIKYKFSFKLLYKDKMRGPRGKAVVQAMIEPIRDTDDEV